MVFDPRNILVIDFGQLGDVVLSLPALHAIRERFPKATITVTVGKPGAEVVQLSGYADSTLVVDRVALRDGPKLVSLARIAKLVKGVRRAQFDFVIDLIACQKRPSGFLRRPEAPLSRRPGAHLFPSNSTRDPVR